MSKVVSTNNLSKSIVSRKFFHIFQNGFLYTISSAYIINLISLEIKISLKMSKLFFRV